MRKLVTVAAAAIMVVGFASLASAADKRFSAARTAVESAGVDVTQAIPGKDFRGRDALVLRSDTRPEAAVDTFMALFKDYKEINGMKVAGIAHLVKTDSWNVTLKNAEGTQVIKIKRAEKGCEIVVRQPRKAPLAK